MTIKIKKGLDIKLLGEAEKTLFDLRAKKFAVKPTDFIGVFPKLLVKEGDSVKAGTSLFFDKNRENIHFTAPVSGTIVEIKRGAKRKLLEIVIEADEEFVFEDFGSANPNELSREDIVEKLLKAGVWPFIRQRPYSVIANPDNNPKAIFISAFDSSPLAADNDYLIHGHGEEFQLGLDAIAKLTSGKLYLNISGNDACSKVFANSKGVEINEFSGPHPAGNVGTQIYNLDPINKGDIVWYLYPQDVLTIGRLFRDGKYDSSRIVALAGSEVLKPRYYKTNIGASIESFTDQNVKEGDKRFISGNVLTGERVEQSGFLGYYNSLITVIPEGNTFDFFGWLLPQFKKFSFYRTNVSWLTPDKKYKLNSNLNGGERAFVMTGQYEKVFPYNIYPMQLIKAVMIEDIDALENLGIYELDDEDFALCEYICPSKINIQSIIRNGLDLMRKEMS